MFNRLYLSDHFGCRYLLLLSHHDRPEVPVPHERFSDKESAARFIRSLNVDNTFWSRILSSEGIHRVDKRNTLDLYEQLANQLQRQSIRIYNITNSTTAEGRVQASAVKQGEKVLVQTATAALANGAQNICTIGNIQQAEKELSVLSDADVAQLATAISPQKPSQTNAGNDQRKAVCQALVDGQLVLQKAKVSGPVAQSPSSESAANTPGARPVDAPPLSDAAAAETSSPPPPAEKPSNDQAQVNTLVAAAEAGTALCEDCSEEESPEPYKIPIPTAA